MPLNLVGDYGGASMFLLFGVLCALFERASSGKGQVVDAAMVDGVASLMSLFWGYSQIGKFDETRRGTHLLRQRRALLRRLRVRRRQVHLRRRDRAAVLRRAAGAPRAHGRPSLRRAGGPEPLAGTQAAIHRTVRSPARADEWCELLEGTDACFAPVLTLSEAASTPTARIASTIVEVDGIRQPAPAPRFSRTPGRLDRPPAQVGQDTVEVLCDWDIPPDRVQHLLDAGAVTLAERPVPGSGGRGSLTATATRVD